MSYEKLGFTSGQTLKAEHLNHMEDGIEAASSGISIKKVAFTDRPSLWNWLQANYTKISNVKLWSNVNQCVDDMIFIGHRNIANGESVPSRFSFYTIYPQQYSTDLELTISRVEVYDNECKIDVYTRYQVVNDTVTSEGQSQTVPDEYWSAMGIEVTIYYFDE